LCFYRYSLLIAVISRESSRPHSRRFKTIKIPSFLVGTLPRLALSTISPTSCRISVIDTAIDISLPPPPCVTVYASRREFTTKQQSSFRRALVSSLKTRPTSHPTLVPKHRSVVRRSERRRRRYLKIRLRRLRRCQRLGVADRGVASDASELAGVAAARGRGRGGEGFDASSLQNRAPPSSSVEGGWVDGWVVGTSSSN